MDDAVFVKDSHSTKIELMCECCGDKFLINTGAKKERWCSKPECRTRLTKGKKRPSIREPSLREMVDRYYDGGDAY